MTPRGPIGREQAGSPAGHPDGVLGGRPSQVRAILTGRPRQDRPPITAEPAQQHPSYRSPQATARTRPSRPTCPHCWQPTWQSVVARRTAGSGPVVAHHASVAPGMARAGWQPPGQGCPPYRPRGLDVLVAEEPRGLGLPGVARRLRLFSRFGLVLPGRASPVILALFPWRSPWLLFGKSGHG
jgi:hypothetical protein